MKKALTASGRADKSAVAASPDSVALQELSQKLADVRAERAVIVGKILTAEKRGENKNFVAAKPALDQQARAFAKLNGSASDFVQAPKRKTPYSDLLDELAVLDRAIEIGSKLAHELHIKARGELAEQRLPEQKEILRQIALTLIGLERTLQAQDAIVAGSALQAFNVGIGRLHNSGSPMYTKLDQLMRLGAITQKELLDEYEAARKVTE